MSSEITKLQKELIDNYRAILTQLGILSTNISTIGGGASFGTYQITVTAADELAGRTDWTAPSDLDVTKPVFALNPYEFGVSALNTGGSDIIRFDTAPVEGDYPLVVYTKISSTTTDINPLKLVLEMSQSSTNDPTAAIFANDLTGAVSYSRSDVGIYTVNSAGSEFTSGKTMPNALQLGYDINGNKITAEWTSTSVITIKTYNTSDVLTDGILNSTPIYIEIYS